MNQNSFITNQQTFLSEIIGNILPKSETVDILVGYFYFSGFEQIYKNLNDKKVRILVGLEVDTNILNNVREIDNLTPENLSRGVIKNKYYEALVKLYNETDTFDSKEKIEAFELFFNKIKDGSLEIKKTAAPCHAKMYLFAYNDSVNEGGEAPGTVITGSSNLSRAGLKDRLEINARFESKQYYNDGKQIFEDLWEEAISIADTETLDDFDTKVIKKIWYEKIYAPYLMYLRVLIEYFNIPTDDNVLMPYDITGGKFYNLKYQTHAVQLALNSIKNHSGVIIADVVGLGKSIIGSTIARNLGLKTIIVAPPHLKTQWEEYKTEFAFPASVFSSGQINAALSHYQVTTNEDEKYLIIIDEAHKYRNEFTEDYAMLHELCANNKVVLLTATPFNNRPSDIYSMVKLFQRPTKSTLKTVENLGAEFRHLIKIYAQLTKDQREKKLSDDEVKKEAQKIASTIRSIIAPLVIRRSRLDLEEIDEYKDDLKQQGIQPLIPNDPQELAYNLGEIQDLYLSTLQLISPRKEDDNEVPQGESFLAARYNPINYVLKDKFKDLEALLQKEYDIEDLNLLIGRQSNIAEFMRKLLVRRFESSVAAFKESLSFMINSSEHILKWIEKRKKVPVFKKGNLPDIEDFYEIGNDNIYVEIEEQFEKYKDKGFFEIPLEYISENFVEDVKSDIELLKSIQKDWFGTDNKITFDPKLESFKKILKRMKAKEPKRKIVVFSEFADTVNYLGAALKNDELGIMKYTSADASYNNKEMIRTNFDAGYAKQTNDYHILIATDAISEGYNLHRAGAIINYDIPYNPTRVIQRIGRINRINKKMFDELFIYNYFPSEIGESETRTKEISTLKMAMIHAIMGEDTKALTKEEELQAFFKARYDQEVKNTEQKSWDTDYKNIIEKAKGTAAYKAALNIVLRSRIQRKIDKGTGDGVLIFGKKGNDFVFKFGTKNEDKPILLTAEEALNIFSALPVEEGFAVSEKFDTIYQKVKSQLFESDTKDEKGKDRLEAMAKIKIIRNKKVLNDDYLVDLMRVIESDSLAGYEIRYINKLKPADFTKLPQIIKQDYINRLVESINSVDEGNEMLILAEEFAK